MNATAQATQRVRRALLGHGVPVALTSNNPPGGGPGHRARRELRLVTVHSTIHRTEPGEPDVLTTTVRTPAVPGRAAMPVPEDAIIALRLLAMAYKARVRVDDQGWPTIIWPESAARVPTWRHTKASERTRRPA